MKTRKSSSRRTAESTYAVYINKIMKQTQPDISISRKATLATGYLVNLAIKLLAQNGACVAKVGGKNTLGARHIQTATRLLLNGDMQTNAVSEGCKATAKMATARATARARAAESKRASTTQKAVSA